MTKSGPPEAKMLKLYQLKRQRLNFLKHSKIFSENFFVFDTNPSSLIFRKTNIEILGIIWFGAFPGLLNAKFHKI